MSVSAQFDDEPGGGFVDTVLKIDQSDGGPSGSGGVTVGEFVDENPVVAAGVVVAVVGLAYTAGSG